MWLANSLPLGGSHAAAFNQHDSFKKKNFSIPRRLSLPPAPPGWWDDRVFPERAVESLEQEDTEAAFYALTLSRVEAFKLMHILQKFKGRKSERKSEHMTLLKDTPQLAFCVGSAWQTPGAERKILLRVGGGGLQDGFQIKDSIASYQTFGERHSNQITSQKITQIIFMIGWYSITSDRRNLGLIDAIFNAKCGYFGIIFVWVEAKDNNQFHSLLSNSHSGR